MDVSVLDLVGRRCLLAVNEGNYRSPEVQEYKVLEVAPSGNWVRFQNCHGNKFWRVVGTVSFIETLKDLKTGKPSQKDAEGEA